MSTLIDASEEADLLVIGSDYTGTGGPARGAHGVRIASGAHCPVVVVPDLEVAGRAGIVVGVDGSPISEQAIAFAAAAGILPSPQESGGSTCEADQTACRSHAVSNLVSSAPTSALSGSRCNRS